MMLPALLCVHVGVLAAALLMCVCVDQDRGGDRSIRHHAAPFDGCIESDQGSRHGDIR